MTIPTRINITMTKMLGTIRLRLLKLLFGNLQQTGVILLEMILILINQISILKNRKAVKRVRELLKEKMRKQRNLRVQSLVGSPQHLLASTSRK